MSKGISLVEILIVITIFAVLGVIVTRSVVLTLQGTQKSTNLVSVRENLDFATGIIERQLRNANSVDCLNSTPANLIYTDQNGMTTNFSCIKSGIASGSASLSLTSPAVTVSACSFVLTCNTSGSSTLPYVDISLTGQSTGTTGVQSSTVTTTTRIYLRNY